MQERVRRTDDKDQWQGSTMKETSAIHEVNQVYSARCMTLRIFASWLVLAAIPHRGSDLHDVTGTTQ